MQNDKKIIPRLVADAGSRHLKPLGLLQKGRSRFWEDDRDWFVIGVNFESSSFSQGSRLDVGCNWLWMVKDYFSYDTGGCIVPFTPFQSEEQFRPVVEEMAAAAAEEVIRCREAFSTPLSLANYYTAIKPEGMWPNFHSAIACALVGEITQAQYFLTQVVESTNDFEWARNARLDAAQLKTLLSDPRAFREAIVTRINQARLLRRLPEREEIRLSQP